MTGWFRVDGWLRALLENEGEQNHIAWTACRAFRESMALVMGVSSHRRNHDSSKTDFGSAGVHSLRVLM